MFLLAVDGHIMPVELGREELRSTAAIAAAASAALKVAEANASASLKEAEANERFSVMETASLKTLGQQAAHLQRRADAAEKTAAGLKVKLSSANKMKNTSAKELASARGLLKEAQTPSTVMAARLEELDGRGKSQSAELARLNRAFKDNLTTAERHRASCDSLLESNTTCVLPLLPSFGAFSLPSFVLFDTIL
jgi:chromosome segregation ATPase